MTLKGASHFTSFLLPVCATYAHTLVSSPGAVGQLPLAQVPGPLPRFVAPAAGESP